MSEEKIKSLPVVESDIRMVSFHDRLLELIGERYREWNTGELIFIHASTGLGKTYATLNYWYEHLLGCEDEIAILVNRRLLKEQLWEDIRKHEIEMDRRKVHLHLFTYQQLERDGEDAEWRKGILKRCRFVVCDECHYFRSDAFFNPGVQKSFDFVTSLYRDTTLIFLSATMKYIRPLIEKRVINLHLEQMKIWENRRQEYKENYIAECLYRKDGSERDLLSYAEKIDEIQQSFEYREDMKYYEEQMAPPTIREYQFLRNLSKNTKVKYFRSMNEMIKLIRSDLYAGKWLIFVSSKNIGQQIRDRLLEDETTPKKVVYIDAEYDEICGTEDEVRKQAQQEVSNIVRTGLFQCDILITTAVLDNGVNIKDEKVKNIVLMTDDEDEFLQMMGRKRFINQDEILNLFISMGDIGQFKKWEKRYYDTYWYMCENKEISLLKAQEMLLNEPNQKSYLLKSYYSFNGFRYLANDLAFEALQTKYIFCRDVSEGLSYDESFFLKRQLEWLGMEYTPEWWNSSSASVSQEEVNSVTDMLNNYYDLGGVLDQMDLSTFGKKLIEVAKKIDPKNFKDKSENIKNVNNALELRQEWSSYEFLSCGDDTTFYEMLLEGKPRNNISEEITSQTLRQIVDEEKTHDWCTIYKKLFKTEIPKCLAKDPQGLKVFINQKLIAHPVLENEILRMQGKGENKRICVYQKNRRSKNDN